MEKPYFKPNNAGLESETRSAGRRVGKLLDALGNLVNGYIADGQMIDDIRTLRISIMDNMRANGWRVTVLESDRHSVLPPKGVGR